MNKKIIKSIIFALCSGLYVTTMATSQVTLNNEVETVLNNKEWSIESEAPQLKIVIKDAYKKAGKTEKVIIELDGADWINTNGTNTVPIEYNNLSVSSVAVSTMLGGDIQYNIDIPNGIKKDEEIGFTIPLCLKVDESEAKDEIYVHVKPGAGTELIDEQSVLIAVKPNKKLTWSLGEVPQIQGKGTISPIYLKEINQYALGKSEIDITLTLKNKDLVFGEFDYISKQVNADDTDYILKQEQYLSYEGGFAGFKDDLKLKIPNKDNKKIIFRIKGSDASELGTLVLKNIPIVNTQEKIEDQDIKLTIMGESIIAPPTEIIVGYMISEETAKKQEVKQEESSEETNSQQLTFVDNKVRFKVGTDYFIVEGKKYDMEGITYIQEPGYIMVPVRYVAYALGAKQEDVSFENGEIMVQYGNRLIQLRVGSNRAVINGNSISMQTALVMKDNISYAPIGEIANLLGVSKSWDSANKEVIFQK